MRRLDQAFDRQWGTDTSGTVNLGELKVDRTLALHGVRYQASDGDRLLEILNKLELPYSNYSFIDFGAGKGRIVLSAALLPFRKVYGVEFSPDLVSRAENNLAAFRRHAPQTAPVEIVCCDAAAFNLPSGNLVCYFYNPFDETIMRKVVESLESALDSAARDIKVIYVDPQCSHLFDRSGRWSRDMQGDVLILRAGSH